MTEKLTSETRSDSELAADILTKRESGEVSRTLLRVDQRVLARITDGIYRRPSSAFRELVSNAYDADATRVYIQTDAPKFNRITIRDNGAGMSPQALANLIYHIGGSSKRTTAGQQLKTVREGHPELSPKGRRLIGKIGIGLFSVAQLSHHFQIITKRKGDAYYTSADIVLRTYSEQGLSKGPDGEAKFITGDVAVTSFKANDVDEHGTDIIIMDLLGSARDALQSRSKWLAAEAAEVDGENVKLPTYHIGRLTEVEPTSAKPDVAASPTTFRVLPNLPWKEDSTPAEKFHELFQKVRGEANRHRNPAVEESLDEYLATMWRLSLACPIRYIQKHPFDLTKDDGIDFYLLSNKLRGSATLVDLAVGETVGSKLNLPEGSMDPCGGFQVFMDSVELLRPVAFEQTLQAKSSIPRPLMFFGKVKSSLGNYDPSLGGGPLEFSSYMYWNSRIIPKENNGVMIRVNNASGVLFDESFMDYKVSELNRLAQITSEVFITAGLDPALNIDRESFNNSHPHYQWVQKWIHAAVKQTTNRLKGLTKHALDTRRQDQAARIESSLARHVAQVWSKRRGEDAEPPPEVVFLDEFDNVDLVSRGDVDSVVLSRSVVEPPSQPGVIHVATEARVRGLAAVLEAYSILESLPRGEQQQLINDILTVFMDAR